MILLCRGCGKETGNEGNICFNCARPHKSRCVHGLVDDCYQCKMQSLKNIAGNVLSEELKYIKLQEKIEKLENTHERFIKLYFKEKNEIEKQITALTEMSKGLSIKHVKLIDIELKKSPYKCPVCDGKGYWRGIEDNISCGGQCHACESKGIVWN
jgi:hypothetical protein